MKTTKLIIIISLIILGLVASSCKDDKATPSGNDPITDTLPGTPQDVGEISNSLLVSFTWTAAENSLNPVESYNLQVGTAAGKSDIFDDNVGNVTTYDVSGDEAQTLYARVQAVYTDTSASAWSGWSDGILIQASSPLSLAWTYQTGDKLRKEPVIFGDLVIFTSTDDTVYALEQSTGTKRWSYAIDTSTDLRSSVFVLGENSLYVTSVGGWYHS
ncbi:MAG: PQQ-binding-like beta-propeller repeat protein, partial [Deltaproteobacteria bacterium]|nr:PQQ-binding-like beta-propeller repeat protein [Deltaproteobacteria bacterium]